MQLPIRSAAGLLLHPVDAGASVTPLAAGRSRPRTIAALATAQSPVGQAATGRADPNDEGRFGRLPLARAIRAGRADQVKLLLSVGADAARPEAASGRTPLAIAVESGQLALVPLLAREMNFEAHVEQAPLVQAYERLQQSTDLSSPEAAEASYCIRLLGLASAAKSGDVQHAEYWARQGADPFVDDFTGKSAVRLAHEAGRPALLRDAARRSLAAEDLEDLQAEDVTQLPAKRMTLLTRLQLVRTAVHGLDLLPSATWKEVGRCAKKLIEEYHLGHDTAVLACHYLLKVSRTLHEQEDPRHLVCACLLIAMAYGLETLDKGVALPRALRPMAGELQRVEILVLRDLNFHLRPEALDTTS